MYYDLEDMIKTNKDGQTPYTPVLPLLYGMQASMKLMRAEGFENVIKRHHRSGLSSSCLPSSSMHVNTVGLAYVASGVHQDQPTSLGRPVKTAQA